MTGAPTISGHALAGVGAEAVLAGAQQQAHFPEPLPVLATGKVDKLTLRAEHEAATLEARC